VSKAEQSKRTKQNHRKNQRYAENPQAMVRRPSGTRHFLGKIKKTKANGSPQRQMKASAPKPMAIAKYSNEPSKPSRIFPIPLVIQASSPGRRMNERWTGPNQRNFLTTS
jgi:hypothetical protein